MFPRQRPHENPPLLQTKEEMGGGGSAPSHQLRGRKSQTGNVLLTSASGSSRATRQQISSSCAVQAVAVKWLTLPVTCFRLSSLLSPVQALPVTRHSPGWRTDRGLDPDPTGTRDHAAPALPPNPTSLNPRSRAALRRPAPPRVPPPRRPAHHSSGGSAAAGGRRPRSVHRAT